MPAPPINCAGAPQEIMDLADDHFRNRDVRDQSMIIDAATAGIVAVPAYAASLNLVIARKGIETRCRHVLKELRPEAKEAVSSDLGNDDTEVVIEYDMIHVTPPQRAPRDSAEPSLRDRLCDRRRLQSSDVQDRRGDSHTDACARREPARRPPGW